MKQKILLLFVILCALICNNVKANESEPNDTKTQANTLALNGNNSGKVNSNDQDWWKVVTNKDGKLDVTIQSLGGHYLSAVLYDNNGVTLITNFDYDNSTSTLTSDGLAVGTYFVKIYATSSGDTGSYKISNTLTLPPVVNDAEPDSSRATALTLPLNASLTGHVGYYFNNHRDTVDEYKVTTTADGQLNVTVVSNNGHYISLYVYDNDGTTALSHFDYDNSSSTLNINGLAAGTYYLKIYTTNSGDFASYTLSNTLDVATPANDHENNNSKANALTLPENGQVTGHVGYYFNNFRDTLDWYEVTTTSDGQLNFTLTSNNGYYTSLYLYDNDGTTLINHFDYNNATTTLSTNGLAIGTYYLKVYCTNVNTDFAPYTLSNTVTSATPAKDKEPNNSKPNAMVLPENGQVTGHAGYYYDNKRDSVDWYKITTTSDGELNLTLTSNNGYYTSLHLYDNNGTTLISYFDYNNSTNTLSVNGLAAGTYYLTVNCTSVNTDFAPYTLSDTLIKPAFANDDEPNNIASKAPTLPANATSYGHVGFYYNNSRDNVDWSKINYTSNNGNLSIALNIDPTLGVKYLSFFVYKDTNAAPIYSQDYINSNININLSSLTQGYYYFKVYATNNTSEFDAYSITPTFTQTNVATVRIGSYDTTGSCKADNSIVLKLGGSRAPYKVQLFRFGNLYQVLNTTKTTFAISNLPAGAYFAKVYGDGAIGNAFDKSKNVFIEPVVTGLSVNNIQTTKVKLNWDTLDCPAYYVIQYRKHGITGWATKETNGNVDAFTLANLTPGTFYDWRIASADSANGITAQSVYSVTSHFTTTAEGFAANNIGVEANISAAQSKIAVMLNVSPNPAVSYFTIHHNITTTEKVNATLLNMNGKAIWSSGLVNVSALNGKQVMVSSFASGLYYLKITNSKGTDIANIKIAIVK